MWQLKIHCHWKPPDDIANLKCFGAPGHQRPNVDGFIDIDYAAPPNRLASAPFISSNCKGLLGFRLPCATPGNEAERKIYGGWVKSPSQFYPFVDQSSRNFAAMYGTNVLSNALARLSVSCFVQKIFTINSRRRRKTKVSFWPPF